MMRNKDKINEIYNEFFSTKTKNPLINLSYACEALGLEENEAMRVIKGHLFSVRTEILTNQTGFKLLYIYTIEKESFMNIEQIKGETNEKD